MDSPVFEPVDVIERGTFVVFDVAPDRFKLYRAGTDRRVSRLVCPPINEVRAVEKEKIPGPSTHGVARWQRHSTVCFAMRLVIHP